MPPYVLALTYALRTLPTIVTTVQALSDAKSTGTDRKEYAKIILAGALTGFLQSVDPNSEKGQMAQGTAVIANAGIDIAGLVSKIVKHTSKEGGAMQQAYDAAKDAGTLGAVGSGLDQGSVPASATSGNITAASTAPAPTPSLTAAPMHQQLQQTMDAARK